MSSSIEIDSKKFLGALSILQESILNGDTNCIEKFKKVTSKLIPDSLLTEDYIEFVDLLKELANSFLPCLSDLYDAKSSDKERMKNNARDVIESVDYLIHHIDNDDQVFSETMAIFNKRIKAMRKLINKFTYIGLRMPSKSLIEAAKLESEEISSFLRQYNKSKSFKEELENLISKYIYKGRNCIIERMIQDNVHQAFSIENHLEIFSKKSYIENYKSTVITLIRTCIRFQNFEFKDIDHDLINFINYGALSETYFDNARKNIADTDKEKIETLEQIKKTFLTKTNLDKLKISSLPNLNIINLTEWLEATSSQSVKIPFLKSCRKKLNLDRGILVQLQKEIHEKRKVLIEIANTHPKAEIIISLINTIESELKKGISPEQKDKLNKIAQSLFPKQAKRFCTQLDHFYFSYRLLPVMEKETADTIKMAKDSLPQIKELAEQLQKFDGGMNDLTTIFNNLFAQSSKGVRFNSNPPIAHTPFYSPKASVFTEDHTHKTFKFLNEKFPNFEIKPFEDNSDTIQKLKVNDFFNPFDVKAFSTNIKSLRTSLKEQFNPTDPLKMVLCPGIGPGCFISSTNTFSIPSFFNPKDFNPHNLYSAISDYICLKKGSEIKMYPPTTIAKILKENQTLHAFVPDSQYNIILMTALDTLEHTRANSDIHQNIFNEFSVYFESNDNPNEEAELDSFFESFLE